MPVVHVAVGVILDARDRILLSRRADGAHQGGLWEFPGGKVEVGESLEAALRRELLEELGIRIGPSIELIEIEHDYGDKQVRLDVRVIRDFSGEPEGLEGQPLAWVAAAELHERDFPAANRPIVAAVQELLGASGRARQ
ncbi:MAG: 8-oxo-dGTP diphosphatase MutT [Halioglobus sp.]|nr:8-oxo-dGTP diphosphatase MutT [Halioglobus sp.]